MGKHSETHFCRYLANEEAIAVLLEAKLKLAIVDNRWVKFAAFTQNIVLFTVNVHRIFNDQVLQLQGIHCQCGLLRLFLVMSQLVLHHLQIFQQVLLFFQQFTNCFTLGYVKILKIDAFFITSLYFLLAKVQILDDLLTLILQHQQLFKQLTLSSQCLHLAHGRFFHCFSHLLVYPGGKHMTHYQFEL